MSAELLPCPFCGSVNLKRYAYGLTTEPPEPDYIVQCADCSAIGKGGVTESAGDANWNRRATPSAQAISEQGAREALRETWRRAERSLSGMMRGEDKHGSPHGAGYVKGWHDCLAIFKALEASWAAVAAASSLPAPMPEPAEPTTRLRVLRSAERVSAFRKAMLDWHAAVVAFGADSQTADKHFDAVINLAAPAPAAVPRAEPDGRTGLDPLAEVLKEIEALESVFGECDSLRAKIMALVAPTEPKGQNKPEREYTMRDWTDDLEHPHGNR